MESTTPSLHALHGKNTTKVAACCDCTSVQVHDHDLIALDETLNFMYI